MRKKISVILVLILLSGIYNLNTSRCYASSMSELEEFNSLFNTYVKRYSPQCQEKIKLINQTVTLSDNKEFTLNGIMADQYNVVLFYTSKNIKAYQLFIQSNSFKPYGIGGYGGGQHSYKLNNKEIGYISLDINLEPINDTITLNIRSDYGTRKMAFPFSKNDFVETYSDTKLNAVLKGEYASNTLTKVYSSALNTILFIEETTSNNRKLEKTQKTIKESELFWENKLLKYKGGGGTRLSDDIFLNNYSFDPIDAGSLNNSLILNYDNYKLDINLVMGHKVISAHTQKELLDAIDDNTTILLDDTLYDFSDLGKQSNVNVNLDDGIIISNVENLSIIGKEGTTLTSSNGTKKVLSFSNCKEITIKNINFEPKAVNSTMNFVECSKVDTLLIENCYFKNGGYGIELENTNKVTIDNIKMENMNDTLINLKHCNDIAIMDSIFFDNSVDSCMRMIDSSTLSLNNCLFYSNTCKDTKDPLLFNQAIRDIIIKDCHFINNSSLYIFNGLALKGNIDFLEYGIFRICDTTIE